MIRRVVTDTLISLSTLAVLIVILVALDSRVRDAVLSVHDGRASAEVAASTSQARRVGSAVYLSVKEQGEEHGPLMVMLVCGVGLALIMFRT